MKSKTGKVIMALLLCPLVMLGLSFALPKRYTATMSLMLDPSIRVARADDPMGPVVDLTNGTRGRSIETEIDKLSGSEVLLNAIQLTAAQHPKAFQDQDQAEAKFESLVNRIRIDNNRNSDIVDLRVTMDDPQIAADTANNIGKAYMDFNDKISSASGNGALMDINKNLTDKEADLKGIDEKIAQIKTKYHISDIVAAGGMQDKLQKDMEAQVAQTQAEYDGAVGELNSAEQSLHSTKQYVKTSTDVQLNPAAVDLDSKINQTSSDLEALRAKYQDGYPQVQQYQQKLDDLKAQRAKTPDNVVGHESTALNPNYTAAKGAVDQAMAKVNSLSGNLGVLQSKLGEMRAESSAYPAAERDLSSLTMQRLSVQNQYQMLVQQKQGIEVSGGQGREALAQIVSVALPPGTPSFPNPKVFVLMGLAVGIIISALIVMPKAPDVMYAPTVSDTLALDGTSMRSTASALPTAAPEPDPVRPAIEQGKPS